MTRKGSQSPAQFLVEFCENLLKNPSFSLKMIFVVKLRVRWTSINSATYADSAKLSTSSRRAQKRPIKQDGRHNGRTNRNNLFG